jgi:hypothetical protein
LPTAFRASLRDFIAWPAQQAGAARVGVASSPIAEVVRYDGGKPQRAVLFVIDHRATPDPAFRLVVPDAAQFNTAWTARGAKVTLRRRSATELELVFPLDATDAVVLERRGWWQRLLAPAERAPTEAPPRAPAAATQRSAW